VHIQNKMKKNRAQRFVLNQKQKKAYQQILQLLQERGTEPVQEEMQIMDGLFYMLNNGWTILTDELLQAFDIIELKNKSQYLEDNLMFYEFLVLLADLFEINFTRLKEYFNIQPEMDKLRKKNKAIRHNNHFSM
jgi:hypothetical protein